METKATDLPKTVTDEKNPGHRLLCIKAITPEFLSTSSGKQIHKAWVYLSNDMETHLGVCHLTICPDRMNSEASI